MKKIHPAFDGPTVADLAAIEAEWPEIQADIDALADPDAVDALVEKIYAVEHVMLLDHRRRRRLTAQMTRTAAELVTYAAVRTVAA